MLARSGDFSIWSEQTTDSVEDDVVNVLITDGQISWEAVIAETDLPPARKAQKWIHLLPILISILRNEECNGIDYSLEFHVQKDQLLLTITEQIEGTTLRSLFLKRAVPQVIDQKESMNKILSLSAGTISKYKSGIKFLDANRSVLLDSINNLQQDLNQVVTYKDDLQTGMLRNMCLLLNSRSNRIRQLESTIQSHNSIAVNDHHNNVEEALSSALKSSKEETFSSITKLSAVASAPKRNTRKKIQQAAVSDSTALHSITDSSNDFDEPQIQSVPDPISNNNDRSTGGGSSSSSSSAMSIDDGTTNSTALIHFPATAESKLNTRQKKVDNSELSRKHRKRKLCDSSDESGAEETG